MKKIILASKSSDRSEILKRAMIPFEICVTNIKEEKYKTKITNAIELVKELAKVKMLYARDELIKKKVDGIIVAADTIVLFNGEIIGKAHNKEQAFNILKKLVGKSHKLITGIAITDIQKSKIIVDNDTTIVEFLELSDEEIWQYLQTKEWKGRAGAYSIMDKASLFISKIIGSSSNVIGLPMHKLYQILKKEFGLNLF
ncbi:MAG: Maf family protein [Candidatus Odinarchaeota archaeon]